MINPPPNAPTQAPGSPGGAPAAPAAAGPQTAGPGFLERWWPHLTAAAGAFIAIALGCLSSRGVVGPWGTAEDITLVVGGLGALGVTVTSASSR